VKPTTCDCGRCRVFEDFGVADEGFEDSDGGVEIPTHRHGAKVTPLKDNLIGVGATGTEAHADAES